FAGPRRLGIVGVVEVGDGEKLAVEENAHAFPGQVAGLLVVRLRRPVDRDTGLADSGAGADVVGGILADFVDIIVRSEMESGVLWITIEPERRHCGSEL